MTMQMALSELFCTGCQGYAHPFLERCPGCGGARRSRYADALQDGPGEPTLIDDPRFAQTAGEASTKFTLWSGRGGVLGAMGSEGAGGLDGRTVRPPAPSLYELTDRVASQLTYRGAGFGDSGSIDTDLRVQGGCLTLRNRKGEQLATIDPALVLAAVPVQRGSTRSTQAFEDAFGPRVAPHFEGLGLVLAWRSPDGPRQIQVGNRSGFFTTHGRREHYLDLAWWIGVLAAASAQLRWRSVGPLAHAIEIGLRAAGPAADATVS